MTLNSKWSRMIAVHESIHDEIVQETPYGQVYSLMSQLNAAQHLTDQQLLCARGMYYGCAKNASIVHEIAATYLGWLSIVGQDHMEAIDCLPYSYQNYLNEARDFATRFARSRFIHYTILQASTYLSFHHRSLWKLTGAKSLADFTLPAEASPNALWHSINTAVSQMPATLMRELLEPSCTRLGIDFDRANDEFEAEGPEQIQWIKANDELVKDLRIALGDLLKLDMILDPDERDNFHRELCDQAEYLFDVEIERLYFRETSHHHLFPDDIQSRCPLPVVIEPLVDDVLNKLASLLDIGSGSMRITTIQSSRDLTVVVSHQDLGSEIYRWEEQAAIDGIKAEIERGHILVDHNVGAVPPLGNAINVQKWLTDDLKRIASSGDETKFYYIEGSFEHWTTVLIELISSVHLYPIQLRSGGQDTGRFIFCQFEFDGHDVVLLKLLPEPAAEFVRVSLSDRGVQSAYIYNENPDIDLIRHLSWALPAL